MKQKRTYVTLLLVVALLCLGIAYAAINGVDLTISGEASAAVVGDRDLEVVFTGATPGENASAKILEGDLTAEFAVTGLTTKGQSASATYTVKNEAADLKAELGTITLDPATDGWFTFTASYGEDFDGILDPNEEVVVTVTATLNQTPQSDDDVTAAAAATTVTIPVEVGDSVQ